jgi:hypothetical protein
LTLLDVDFFGKVHLIIGKKIALITWKKLCLRKEVGGLGILELHHQNLALLLKWWWKFHDFGYSSVWKEIIRAKYDSLVPKSHMI